MNVVEKIVTARQEGSEWVRRLGRMSDWYPDTFEKRIVRGYGAYREDILVYQCPEFPGQAHERERPRRVGDVLVRVHRCDELYPI